MFTDYSLNLGSYEVIYMYSNMDKPDNLHINTHPKKVFNISHLLRHVKIDMDLHNTQLTAILLPKK
jgi:hypothetical protein